MKNWIAKIGTGENEPVISFAEQIWNLLNGTRLLRPRLRPIVQAKRPHLQILLWVAAARLHLSWGHRCLCPSPIWSPFPVKQKERQYPKNNCGVFNCYSLRLEKCCETNRIQQRRHKLWQVDCLFRLEDDKRSDWWCSVPLCQLPWLDHHCLGRKTSDSPTTCLNSPAQYRQPQSRWVPLKICQSE